MTEQEVFSALTEIFRSVLDDETLTLTSETTPNDIPKWDSFRFVEIILQVEETLGTRIRAKEANKLRNIGEMVALIQTKRAA